MVHAIQVCVPHATLLPVGARRWRSTGAYPGARRRVHAIERSRRDDTYVYDVEIHTTLPWKPTAGIHNVPIGIPVLLHGKEQATYDWSLDAPGGSGATLMDATTRNPEFGPDVAGLYTVDVTEEAGEGATVSE